MRAGSNVEKKNERKQKPAAYFGASEYADGVHGIEALLLSTHLLLWPPVVRSSLLLVVVVLMVMLVVVLVLVLVLVCVVR